jgi:Flp pilus assembly protein TadB
MLVYQKSLSRNCEKFSRKSESFVERRKNNQVQKFLRKRRPTSATGDKMDTTTRWLSMLGIGTLCFGLSLFVLRIPIRTIIVFFIIGVPLVALWLYVDAKSKQQKKITTTVITQPCICSICKHEEAKRPFQENCACCLLTKGNTVIGHSINPLQ